MAENFFERHCGKIELGAPTGCWLWAGSVNGQGYGSVWARGSGRKAHREAFEAVHGAGSAAGLCVRHRCDTPACVNPGHLEVGTLADNNRDRDERGRQVAPRGEANGNSRLTVSDVQTIRSTYVRRSRTAGQHALARRFGVAHSLIGQIVRCETWAHVQ